MVYPASTNLLVLMRELLARVGAMFVLQAGSRTLCMSLLTVEATAVVPLGRWNTTLDGILVGIDGANGRRACNVAPVLLTADEIVPLRTPSSSVVVEEVGLQMASCCCKFARNMGCNLVLLSRNGQHQG
jgi:hypothetical protein